MKRGRCHLMGDEKKRKHNDVSQGKKGLFKLQSQVSLFVRKYIENDVDPDHVLHCLL